MKSAVISRSERRQIQHAYERALLLMNDPAANPLQPHQLLVECIIRDPATPIYIEALLANLAHRTSRSSQGWFSRIRNRKFLRSPVNDVSPETLRRGLAILYRDPANVSILCHLAEIWMASGLFITAECYLNQALSIQPGSVRAIPLLARSLVQQARFEEALACWQKVPATCIDDARISQVIDYLHSQLPAPGTNPMELTVPLPVEDYLERSREQMNQHQWETATTLLEQGLATAGTNAQLIDQLETVRMESQLHRCLIADGIHELHPGLIARETIEDLYSERDRTELQVCERRARRYPHNPAYQLDLAGCLKRSGNYRMALKQLAAIPKTAPNASEASLEAAKCHQYLHQFDEAAAIYHELVDELENRPNDRIYEEALYHGSLLTHAQGNLAEARLWLERLLKLAPGHEDARHRLDKMLSIGDNRESGVAAAGPPGTSA